MALKIGSYPVLRKLPDEYYPIIGRIIVDWAYVESLLRDCVYMLLRLNRRDGRTAVRAPRASEIVLMVEELMQARSFTTKVDTREYRKALETVAIARDALGHGVWLDHPDSDVPVLQIVSGSYPVEPGAPKAKARLTPVAMVTSTQDLELTIRDVARMAETAETLRSDVEAQAGPLPDIPQPQ